MRKISKLLVVGLIVIGFLLPYSTLAVSQFCTDTGGTLTTGLVAYYNLNDGTDSWSTNNLTQTGSIANIPAKIGNGAVTTSTSAYYSILNNLGVVSSTTPYSISGWVKLTAEIGAGSYAFGSAGDATSDTGIELRYDYNAGTRRLQFDHYIQSQTTDATFYNVALGTANWNYLTITFSTSTGIQGYLNGALVATTSFTGTGGGVGHSTVSFVGGGNRSNGGTTADYVSNAIQDEFGFWNKTLSTTEITDLYNGGNGQTLQASCASAVKRRYPIIIN